MSLKAVLFDFNGVIINDERIHLQLIDEILIAENLQPQKASERQAGLGQSDRAYFQDLFHHRGRLVTQEYLTKLLHRKAEAYVEEMAKIAKLPLYPGVEDLIYQLRSLKITPDSPETVKLALVSGAIRPEIELILERAKLTPYFPVIVAGDDITTSKPQPDGYLLAVDRLNQAYPDLDLKPQECLAIEDTPVGIEAARQAQMQVVGVANTYPFHMLQRCCNWTVDYLIELELERVQEIYSQKEMKLAVPEC
ncbi:HAD family phosphatase [Nodularia harveyana UHCC-0300]|uniref:HAD family phosphatase n=1 Tax=Nodularia harveyana UHCC-0300 TaxID=2974287 RepID=A0ABU5UCM3_9CYAN|nr:HAD family phosphatase [Nodularia harveyana]MEA5581291.1 HAD family phosphatase [Nodularia harveyana UHCC-0300]